MGTRGRYSIMLFREGGEGQPKWVDKRLIPYEIVSKFLKFLRDSVC
jgi:hypothetical protein